MKRVAVIANLQKDGALRAAEELRHWAGKHGAEVVSNLPEAIPPAPGALEQWREQLEGCDLAVTLGGDGTLLYGVQLVAPLEIPVLAVNLGSLGFHTQIEPSQLVGCLDAILTGDFHTDRRLMLQATLEDGSGNLLSGPMYALNDIVVSRGAFGHMVRLRVSVDDQVLTDLFADGLILATPTGSSAYNYAAYGPVLEPRLEAIVLNAVCPHRMRVAPLVMAPSVQVRVEFHARKPREEAQLLVDGRQWCATSHDQRLKISRAPMYLPLVTFDGSFYEKLRDKLAWGGLS